MKTIPVYLKDYQPCPFLVEKVYLCFDIQGLDKVHVTNEMYLKRLAPGALFLNGEDLTLQSIAIDGVALDKKNYQLSDEGLTIKTDLEKFILKVETIINPLTNTALMGLYASRQMLCSQCESEGFRRITYFFDRPDVLTIFTTKIIANEHQFPILLSNGNLIYSGDKDHKRFVVWQDPYPKPCYLFALVAGNLAKVESAFVTQSKHAIQLEIYVDHGDEHLCDIAMQAIKDAMRWDEVRFGREYDLKRYMIVAVKDFNMGAMENKGLNIFNAKYVLADPHTATDDDMFNIESVIAHEYFHNWTGNRVTCRDWFQLSLKEGLTIYRDQSFSSDQHGAVAQRINDVIYLRTYQFAEDAGAMRHPVQPKSYEEISNFYTTTIYEKGAEIVRMYEVLLGVQGFRRGMDLYFERHDGQAVRIEDFLAAMSDANEVDLTAFKAWYDEPGTPILNIQESLIDEELSIEISQTGTKQALMIPIRWSVYNKEGKRLKNLPDLLVLTQKKQMFRFPLKEKEIHVNYLQGFSAPVIVKRTLSIADRLALLSIEEDGFALWDLKQQLWIDAIQSSYLEKELVPINEAMLNILQQWIHSNKSPDLLHKLFNMPSLEECILGLTEVDITLMENSRLAFQKQLAIALEEHFKQVFDTIIDKEWRNTCMRYLMLANEALYLERTWQQFRDTDNMTDKLATFRCLSLSTRAEEAIEAFYQDWQQNELVLDKWFSVQALIPEPKTLQRVKSLISHPTFNWSNPNKVRALIGSFIQNHLIFHAIDGSGYAFLTDCIKVLDKINPQVASRIVIPFTRALILDKTRRTLIQAELEDLMKTTLSSDVYEMVSKSLT